MRRLQKNNRSIFTGVKRGIAGGFATPMHPALGSCALPPCRYLLPVRDLTPAL